MRLLRAAGQKVDVQNYIDNTGVQVADVVVGFHASGGQIACGCAAIAGRTQSQERTHRLLLLGSLCAHIAVVRRREQTKRMKRARNCAMPLCMRWNTATMRRPRSPNSSQQQFCGGILRPCCASASNTIFCPAKARFCTSNSGRPPLSSSSRRASSTLRPRARTKAVG